MKKLFSMILALALLATLCAPALGEEEIPLGDVAIEDAEPSVSEDAPEEEADAEPEAAVPAGESEIDVTGHWYGSMLGMQVDAEFYGDGGYMLQAQDAEGTRTGRWTIEKGVLYADRDTDNELAFEIGEDELTVTLNGVKVELGREPVETFMPADELPEDRARLKNFAGHWICSLVSVFGVVVDPTQEAEDTPLDLVIDGEDVTITTPDSDESVTTTGFYKAGVLTLDLGEAAEGDDGMSCTMRVLEDGMLRVDVVTAVGTMSYFMTAAPMEEPAEEAAGEPAEADEAAAAEAPDAEDAEPAAEEPIAEEEPADDTL